MPLQGCCRRWFLVGIESWLPRASASAPRCGIYRSRDAAWCGSAEYPGSSAKDRRKNKFPWGRLPTCRRVRVFRLNRQVGNLPHDGRAEVIFPPILWAGPPDQVTTGQGDEEEHEPDNAIRRATTMITAAGVVLRRSAALPHPAEFPRGTTCADTSQRLNG